MADVKSWPSTGIANKSNLSTWADYAKGNSYTPDKGELKHKLGTDGAAADLKINEAETPALKPYEEGRGSPTPARTAASATKCRSTPLRERGGRSSSLALWLRSWATATMLAGCGCLIASCGQTPSPIECERSPNLNVTQPGWTACHRKHHARASSD